MHTLDPLSKDEIHLLEKYRSTDRLTRAAIMLAARGERNSTPDELQLLEVFALYMECNDFGRARLVEGAEILAAGGSQAEVQKRLAELDAGVQLQRADVFDITTGQVVPEEKL